MRNLTNNFVQDKAISIQRKMSSVLKYKNRFTKDYLVTYKREIQKCFHGCQIWLKNDNSSEIRAVHLAICKNSNRRSSFLINIQRPYSFELNNKYFLIKITTLTLHLVIHLTFLLQGKEIHGSLLTFSKNISKMQNVYKRS